MHQSNREQLNKVLSRFIYLKMHNWQEKNIIFVIKLILTIVKGVKYDKPSSNELTFSQTNLRY